MERRDFQKFHSAKKVSTRRQQCESTSARCRGSHGASRPPPLLWSGRVFALTTACTRHGSAAAPYGAPQQVHYIRGLGRRERKQGLTWVVMSQLVQMARGIAVWTLALCSCMLANAQNTEPPTNSPTTASPTTASPTLFAAPTVGMSRPASVATLLPPVHHLHSILSTYSALRVPPVYTNLTQGPLSLFFSLQHPRTAAWPPAA